MAGVYTEKSTVFAETLIGERSSFHGVEAPVGTNGETLQTFQNQACVDILGAGEVPDDKTLVFATWGYLPQHAYYAANIFNRKLNDSEVAFCSGYPDIPSQELLELNREQLDRFAADRYWAHIEKSAQFLIDNSYRFAEIEIPASSTGAQQALDLLKRLGTMEGGEAVLGKVKRLILVNPVLDWREISMDLGLVKETEMNHIQGEDSLRTVYPNTEDIDTLFFQYMEAFLTAKDGYEELIPNLDQGIEMHLPADFTVDFTSTSFPEVIHNAPLIEESVDPVVAVLSPNGIAEEPTLIATEDGYSIRTMPWLAGRVSWFPASPHVSQSYAMAGHVVSGRDTDFRRYVSEVMRRN